MLQVFSLANPVPKVYETIAAEAGTDGLEACAKHGQIEREP